MFTKAQDSSVSLNYLPYINNAIRGRHRMPASYYIIWDVTKSPDPDVTLATRWYTNGGVSKAHKDTNLDEITARPW